MLLCFNLLMVNLAELPVQTTLLEGVDIAHHSELAAADTFFLQQLGHSSVPTLSDLRKYDYSNRILGLTRLDDDVVGGVYGIMFAATSLSEPYIDIHYLAVAKHHRKSGQRIGSYLLSTIEAAAIEHGAHVAQLTTLEGAVGFWGKHNYKPADKRDPYTLIKYL